MKLNIKPSGRIDSTMNIRQWPLMQLLRPTVGHQIFDSITRTMNPQRIPVGPFQSGGVSNIETPKRFRRGARPLRAMHPRGVNWHVAEVDRGNEHAFHPACQPRRNGRIACESPNHEGLFRHQHLVTQTEQIICEENGVVIRSFPAIHCIDGSVSFSLEWNGLKFVYPIE